jgi:hypothetical protein
LGVVAIVRRLMAKDRTRRFQTPAELAVALAPWCGGGSGRSAPPAAEPAPVPAPPEELQETAFEPLVAQEIDTSQVSSGPPSSTPWLSAPIDSAFRDQWEQWTAIVESSLRRRGAHRWIHAEAFERFHGALVAGCEALARETDGPQRAFFESLTDLVKPWLTPDSLMQTDPEVHDSVLRLCHRAQVELDRWSGIRPVQRQEGDTAVRGVLSRFRSRRERLEFKAKMRRLFGVEL